MLHEVKVSDFRLMKMISFKYKTAKNQFYLLMMLIVKKNQSKVPKFFGTLDFHLILFPII